MTLYKKNNFKIFLINVLVVLILILPIHLQAAPISSQVNGGVVNAGKQVYGEGIQTNFALGLITIINQILNLIGILFFLLLIYAGYLWMMARGKEEQIEKAKNITREVVIALIIILLARVLTEFLLTQIGKAI